MPHHLLCDDRDPPCTRNAEANVDVHDGGHCFLRRICHEVSAHLRPCAPVAISAKHLSCEQQALSFVFSRLNVRTVASAQSRKGAGLEDLQGRLDEWVLWHHTLRRPSLWWQAGAPRQTPQVHRSGSHQAGPDAACKHQTNKGFPTYQRLGTVLLCLTSTRQTITPSKGTSLL